MQVSLVAPYGVYHGPQVMVRGRGVLFLAAFPLEAAGPRRLSHCNVDVRLCWPAENTQV